MNGKILTGIDWDGTCIDTAERLINYSARVIQNHFGGTYEKAKADYLRTYGKAFPLQLEELFADAPDDVIEKCAKEYDNKKWDAVYAGAKLFPGTTDALARLTEPGDCIVGIITGNRGDMTQRMVEENNLGKYITFIRGKADGEKPHNIIWAASKYKPRQPVFFVGDAKSDVGLNQNIDIINSGLSIVTIGVRGGFDTEKDLIEAGASQVLEPENIGELPDLVRGYANDSATVRNLVEV